ncbi:putative galacturan 1,4-alpha-galacturonidase A [Hypsizygus marmoreus]|uniref:galacturonan 1,4-alpha-galacturonidase n=1 Tax=Hypsizygus marmoreus TaxID=39966 RepID=A0A369K0K0_HYPMA|nr:putative galacturan 1,4-alpha-galacturonidase A [Hypsizygus marmoreus]
MSEIAASVSKTCSVSPLGAGKDDTDQVERAIATCGHFGATVFESGTYNITRKMTWDLVSSKVDLKGYLSFKPDIQYWLNSDNTYRVVFIQSQASWFVVTGSDFVIDAHNSGGIQGNGQPWWSYFATHTKADGDGRPIALTLWKVARGTIRNFRIVSPPFWANTAAESTEVVYDGMYVNATNIDPLYFGKNVVPNTDGINTYRSDNVTLLNWDVTCGDDCLAIKGNSTNIVARNVTCRGGNGIAFGSLGQYANLSDFVSDVHLENLVMTRIDPNIQPNMGNGVYFKTWTGTVNGSPPTGGGGGYGSVNNVLVKSVRLDRVNAPLHLYQTNGGHSGDAPSTLKFNNLTFVDWGGTALTNKIVDIECSPAAGCTSVSFDGFNVTGPVGQAPRFICQNVIGVNGLDALCNATGQAFL